MFRVGAQKAARCRFNWKKAQVPGSVKAWKTKIVQGQQEQIFIIPFECEFECVCVRRLMGKSSVRTWGGKMDIGD